MLPSHSLPEQLLLERRVTFPERRAACRLAVDREHLVPVRRVVQLARPLAVDLERPVVVHPVARVRPRPAEHSAGAVVVQVSAAAAVERTHSTR